MPVQKPPLDTRTENHKLIIQNTFRDDFYLLIDFNADSTLSNVPDPTRASMVELVGHAFVDGPVNLDIDIIPNFVNPEIGR